MLFPLQIFFFLLYYTFFFSLFLSQKWLGVVQILRQKLAVVDTIALSATHSSHEKKKNPLGVHIWVTAISNCADCSRGMTVSLRVCCP